MLSTRHTRLPWRLAVAVLIAGAIGACSGDDAAPSTTVALIVPDVPAGAAQTPFCSGMSDISLRVNTDPPTDLNSYLITEYEALLPVVPSAIESEFRSVLGNLRGAPESTAVATTTITTTKGTTTTGTTDPSGGFAEEGYLPDEEPELRLNAYLADKCFGTQSNPGPPPTEPFSEVPDTSTAPTTG